MCLSSFSPLKTAVLLDIYPYIISFPSRNGNFTRVLSPFLSNPNGHTPWKGGGADVGLCWPRDVLQHGARVWNPSGSAGTSWGWFKHPIETMGLLKILGKSPFSMGKSTISMAIFNSFLLTFTRGYISINPLVHHFPDEKKATFPFGHAISRQTSDGGDLGVTFFPSLDMALGQNLLSLDSLGSHHI